MTPSDQRRCQSSPLPAKFPLLKRAASTPSETTNENSILHFARGINGELASVSNLQPSWNRQTLSKKRSQYYEGAFACRDANNTARARVTRESMVIAEVKLYCKVGYIHIEPAGFGLTSQKLEHEQPFLADLSFQLCEIYQRPESSVMVILAQAPILLGGNAGPAYFITIKAVSSEIAPTKNKRSTVLIQTWILECLQIPLDRGVIRFEATAEENLATNGKTLLQEIEEMERRPNEGGVILRTISRNRGKMGRKSPVPIFNDRGKTPTLTSTPGAPVHLMPGLAETTHSKSSLPNGTTPSKKKRIAKSIFMAFFGQEQYRES